MNDTPNIEQKTTYSGVYEDIPFEIVHWGVERGKLEPMNNGKGCWNYYIYLYEGQVENFEELWIPNERMKWTETSHERLSTNYGYSGGIHEVPWHGGVTYWESRHDSFVGHRMMKIGCDYNHIWDEDRGHPENFQSVLFDCMETIDNLVDREIVKLNK